MTRNTISRTGAGVFLSLSTLILPPPTLAENAIAQPVEAEPQVRTTPVLQVSPPTLGYNGVHVRLASATLLALTTPIRFGSLRPDDVIPGISARFSPPNEVDSPFEIVVSLRLADAEEEPSYSEALKIHQGNQTEAPTTGPLSEYRGAFSIQWARGLPQASQALIGEDGKQVVVAVSTSPAGGSKNSDRSSERAEAALADALKMIAVHVVNSPTKPEHLPDRSSFSMPLGVSSELRAVLEPGWIVSQGEGPERVSHRRIAVLRHSSSGSVVHVYRVSPDFSLAGANTTTKENLDAMLVSLVPELGTSEPGITAPCSFTPRGLTREWLVTRRSWGSLDTKASLTENKAEHAKDEFVWPLLEVQRLPLP